MALIYDVIILGAGVAATACALTLKDSGLTCIILSKKSSTKACGGGITDKAIPLLEGLGIGLSRLLENDAKIINQAEYIFKSAPTQEMDFTSRPYSGYSIGISRKLFDSILAERLKEENIRVLSIDKDAEVKRGDPLTVNGMECRNIVYATGSARANVHGIKKEFDRTFGISAEVTAKLALSDDTFRFYMNENRKDSDYGWIFPVGTDKWNIGVWQKDSSSVTKEQFEKFRKEIFLPKASDVYGMEEPKGGFINCGSDSFYKQSDNVYFAGDCAATANPINGEGIYQALKSGIEAAGDIARSIKS